MAKLTLTNLSSLQNEQSAINIINNNNDAIEAAVEKTLSRDGTVPNQMTSELDMNSNRVLNLPQPLTDAEPLRLAELNEFLGGTGDGNVIGPVSSVGGNYPVFSGSSGKILADSGTSPSTKADVASPTISDPTFTGTTTANGPVVLNSLETIQRDNQHLLKLTNTTATNGSKTLYIAPNGEFWIINNAVSGVPLSLTDSGNLTISGSLTDVVPTATVKGRVAGGSGPSTNLNQAQLTTLINPVTSSLSGAAPASGGGTSNYLRADATWADPRSKVLLNTYTASGSSSLQDTACFTTTYTSYELEFINLIPSTSNTNIQLQVYSGGSFQTASYNSSYSYFTGAGVGNNTTSTYIQLNAPTVIPNTISGLYGTIRVWNPGVASSSPKNWMGQFCHQSSSTSGMYVHTVAGNWYNGAALTGFRVFPSAGNLTSGIIKLYGYL